jgi:hypothetical protein
MEGQFWVDESESDRPGLNYMSLVFSQQVVPKRRNILDLKIFENPDVNAFSRLIPFTATRMDELAVFGPYKKSTD